MKTAAYFGQISQPNNRFLQYDSYYSIFETYRLEGWPKMTPLKWWNLMFLTKVIMNRKAIQSFDLFWPGISPQQCILTKWFILQHYWKLWASGETKMTPLNCQKMMFLIQNIYITNNDWNLWDFWPDISAQPWILTTWFSLPHSWKIWALGNPKSPS